MSLQCRNKTDGTLTLLGPSKLHDSARLLLLWNICSGIVSNNSSCWHLIIQSFPVWSHPVQDPGDDQLFCLLSGPPGCRELWNLALWGYRPHAKLRWSQVNICLCHPRQYLHNTTHQYQYLRLFSHGGETVPHIQQYPTNKLSVMINISYFEIFLVSRAGHQCKN